MPAVTLTPEEARVLGCLMEKSVTTPDNYPLSLNATMIACNQSTNREPIVRYSEETVDRALDSLREKQLTRRVKGTGQRVIKHRHVAEETLALDRPESALLGVLLLRGPQTPGELKQRAERWHGFRSLADVEDALGRLTAAGLAEQLARRPGQKEARWMQLLAPSEPSSVEGAIDPARVPVSVDIETDLDAGREPETLAPAPAPPPAQPHSLEVRNPATDTVIRSVAVTDPSEVDQKVARARTAQVAWGARPFSERAEKLAAFRDLLEREAEECAQLTTSELGKPIRQSRNEIRAVFERVDWNIEHTSE